MSSVHVSPFMRADYSLAGFVISGRWPSTTHEWSQFLALAVRIAAYPGTLARTSVFRSIDDLPEDPQPDTVGLVTLAGPIIGDDRAAALSDAVTRLAPARELTGLAAGRVTNPVAPLPVR